jgi:hypothetical protein
MVYSILLRNDIKQVKEIKIILDALANEASEKDKIVMKNHFATSYIH